MLNCLNSLYLNLTLLFALAFSLGQCGRSVHVGGGEVHRQHHERLLRCSCHRSINRGVCPLVWTTDKYVRLSQPHRSWYTHDCLPSPNVICHTFHILISLFFPSCAAISFASGAILVCVSIYLYGLPKQDTSQLSRKDTDTESKQKTITVWIADLQHRSVSHSHWWTRCVSRVNILKRT